MRSGQPNMRKRPAMVGSSSHLMLPVWMRLNGPIPGASLPFRPADSVPSFTHQRTSYRASLFWRRFPCCLWHGYTPRHWGWLSEADPPTSRVLAGF